MASTYNYTIKILGTSHIHSVSALETLVNKWFKENEISELVSCVINRDNATVTIVYR